MRHRGGTTRIPAAVIAHRVKCRHNPAMKIVLTILGVIFGCLGLAVTWKDVTASDRPWHVIGEIWFEWAPSSLQVSEAVVSRYIDPCGLFVSLNCEPFIWHPGVSTILGFYAAPVFLLLGLGLALTGRWLGMRRKKARA